MQSNAEQLQLYSKLFETTSKDFVLGQEFNQVIMKTGKFQVTEVEVFLS